MLGRFLSKVIVYFSDYLFQYLFISNDGVELHDLLNLTDRMLEETEINCAVC